MNDVSYILPGAVMPHLSLLRSHHKAVAPENLGRPSSIRTYRSSSTGLQLAYRFVRRDYSDIRISRFVVFYIQVALLAQSLARPSVHGLSMTAPSVLNS